MLGPFVTGIVQFLPSLLLVLFLALQINLVVPMPRSVLAGVKVPNKRLVGVVDVVPMRE